MKESIFGVNPPKYIYDPEGTAVTVLLDFVNVDPTWADPQDIMHSSVINGHRSMAEKGDYAEFKLLMDLFQYADPRSKFEEIIAHNKKEVRFFPHSDNESLYFTCIMTVQPFYLDSSLYGQYDKLIITFKSTDYVDLSNGAAPVIQANEIIMDGGTVV